MTTGWLIGVLVDLGGGASPTRYYYAVAQDDRCRAEWSAVDMAMTEGPVAASPSGGMEPVEALSPLSLKSVGALGLRPGQIRALGIRWPRRWLRDGVQSED